MSPFRFELAPIESIAPWGAPSNPNLSWFALTWGDFWIELGRDELFRYTPAALAMWGLTKPYVDYQIAEFVRDLRSCVGPALAPLPDELARAAADVHALADLQSSTKRAADAIGKGATFGPHYSAWRWLGERSPFTGYLVAGPRFYFIRRGDEIELGYDNRDRLIDGVPAWTAQTGTFRLSMDALVSAVNGFSTALLDAMALRIDDIEQGRATPQTSVDVGSLRKQHESWTRELSEELAPTPPDVPWDVTLAALRALGATI